MRNLYNRLSHPAVTHCILVDSSTVIYWTSLFVILGVSHLFRRLYSIFDEKSCWQTLKTKIRRHMMWRLIWVCIVCLLLFTGFQVRMG